MQASISSLKFIALLWSRLGPLCLALALLFTQTASSLISLAPQPCPAFPVRQALPGAGAPASSQHFALTGKTVRGDFLNVFNRYGLQVIGYPVSEEQQENGRVVQYFERVRMERHPELSARGYGVMLSRLGDTLSKADQPFPTGPTSGATQRSTIYIRETNHTLSEPFLSFWKSNGGVALFGYPISEPMSQDGMRVQWFERARFEYHPELANRGQAVQLSLLGSAAYNKTNINAISTVSAKEPASPVQANKATAVQPGLSDMENYIFKSVNESRAAAGLGAVQLNSPLIDMSRARSNDMATRNYFSHTTPEGTNFLDMLNTRSFPYKFAGEILARNNYANEQAAPTAMTSYLNSPPHKAIIMDGRYKLVGVGYAKSTQEDMHYFTVLFAQQ